MTIVYLCKNDPLISTIRDLFDAIPLRVPEERIQPMCVVASNRRKSFFLGRLEHILQTGVKSDVLTSQMPDLSGEHTRKVKLHLGLQVLDGFLRGFGVPAMGIESAFDGATEVSFSFRDVRRKYVEITRLGKSLAKQKINLQNPVASIFNEGKKFDLLVIDSIITSSDFTIRVDKKKNENFRIDLPLVQSLIAQADTMVQVSSATGFDLTFQGSRHLTFAFSCVRFFLDLAGTIFLIEPGTYVPSLGMFSTDLVSYTPDRILLSSRPGLLSWDES
jgi:hypothetical protein